MTTSNPKIAELDLRTFWSGLRRYLPQLILAVALAGIASYLLSSKQPAVYQARSIVMAAGSTDTNRELSSTLVSAPPLPTAAVELAVHSPDVVEDIIKRLSTDPAINTATVSPVINQLRLALRSGAAYPVNVISQQAAFSTAAIYQVAVTAAQPEMARRFADHAAEALLSWDAGRAKLGVSTARSSLELQLKEIDRQLTTGGVSGLERSTLVATRSSVTSQLARVSILENSAIGTLSHVSRATTPLKPIAPRPMRQAVTAAVLTGLLGLLLVGLVVANDRRIRTEDDLETFDLPLLAQIPKVKQKAIQAGGIGGAAGTYEAVGFLRLNVMSYLKGAAQSRVLITSATPGEGKSSVTAALARGLGTSGQRVLIIDADLRRGTQAKVWEHRRLPDTSWRTVLGHEGAGEPARDTRAALTGAPWIQVCTVAENIDLLPAGAGHQTSLQTLLDTDLERVLQALETQYDVVIIDSAPVLALPDTLVIAPHVTGVIMVVGQGQVSQSHLRRSIERITKTGTGLIGVVLNRVTVQQGYYSYKYQAQGQD